MNSLDPQLTDEKRAKLFKNLIKERYYITKNTSTSYAEVGEMTPIERKYILEFLQEESETIKKAVKDRKSKGQQTMPNNNLNSNIRR